MNAEEFSSSFFSSHFNIIITAFQRFSSENESVKMIKGECDIDVDSMTTTSTRYPSHSFALLPVFIRSERKKKTFLHNNFPDHIHERLCTEVTSDLTFKITTPGCVENWLANVPWLVVRSMCVIHCSSYFHNTRMFCLSPSVLPIKWKLSFVVHFTFLLLCSLHPEIAFD